MWSGAARSTPINAKTDRKKPSAWRTGTRKTRRSVNAVSIAQSENVFGAPGRPDGDGRHASVASAESHSVTSPRWTKACSYADQCPTRSFVLCCGWTFDLMSRSCTRSGHRGQRADSCLVAAEGLCTNAHQGSRAPSTLVSQRRPASRPWAWDDHDRCGWRGRLDGPTDRMGLSRLQSPSPEGPTRRRLSENSGASLRQVPRIPTDVAIARSPVRRTPTPGPSTTG